MKYLTACHTKNTAINVRTIFTLKIHTKLIIKYLQVLKPICENHMRERRKELG